MYLLILHINWESLVNINTHFHGIKMVLFAMILGSAQSNQVTKDCSVFLAAIWHLQLFYLLQVFAPLSLFMSVLVWNHWNIWNIHRL